MSKRDAHPIDSLATELQAELAQHLQAIQSELHGAVPVGQRRLSPQEKFQRFMALTPQQRDTFRQQMGGRWDQYEEEQLRYAVSILGGAAMNLLPYIAPTVSLAMEGEEGQ